MKKKTICLIVSLLIVLGLTAGVLFFPISFQVERIITIKAPPEKTFSVVSDFNEWPKWSPWLVMEPAAQVFVSGNGKSVGDIYSWKGDLVGEGEMEHIRITAPASTEMEIRVTKPFASTSKVQFLVAPTAGDENQSTATWLMEGKIPRLMKNMMGAWIGMDYERGLKMLKEYCETGTVVTKTIIDGEVNLESMSYLGIVQDCDFSDISNSMEDSFTELNSKLQAAGLTPEGQFLSVYTDFDMINNHIDYIAAYPVSENPGSLPEGLIFGEIPSHKAFKVTHLGPFRNVGNGWSTGMQHLQMNKVKQSKSVMPYELMPVDVSGTPEAEIRAEIFFPLR